MTNREKKKKAAAIAVACFLQQELEGKPILKDQWGQMGKNRIMEGRDFLQRKGRVPGPAK